LLEVKACLPLLCVLLELEEHAVLERAHNSIEHCWSEETNGLCSVVLFSRSLLLVAQVNALLGCGIGQKAQELVLAIGCQQVVQMNTS
jgi:hypothetical protein